MVGGLATVLHGYPRLTVDIDLIVDLAPEEARKAVDVLAGRPQDFADIEALEAIAAQRRAR